MNLSRAFRRTAALAGAALVATAATLAFASPASAHHTDLEAETKCLENGAWQVTWTLINSEEDLAGKLKLVVSTPADKPAPNFAVNAVLPAGGTIVGVQVLAASDASAFLKVKTKWVRDGNRKYDTDEKTINRPGNCPAPPASPSPDVTPSASPSVPAPTTPSEPTLPVTGPGVWGVVGMAVALLVAGAAAFVVARRRRINFTA